MTQAKSIAAGTRPHPWMFLVAWIFTLLVFWRPVQAVITLSFENELYSHLVLIPFISLALIFFRRQQIFHELHRMPSLGGALLALAVILCGLVRPWSQASSQRDHLMLAILAMVLLWISTFLVLNGPKAAAAALFPLGFLLLAVPLPSSLLEDAVVLLQKGSAEVTYVLFRLLGVPVFRQGFQFSLPGLKIEVAEECSGIHSAVALMIVGMLVAHILLYTTWKQIFFVLITIPVAILKNGIRIVTLSYLGLHVNRNILDGPLHHQGGALFATLGLALLLPILLLLRRDNVPRNEP
jgi:exosortase